MGAVCLHRCLQAGGVANKEDRGVWASRLDTGLVQAGTIRSIGRREQEIDGRGTIHSAATAFSGLKSDLAEKPKIPRSSIANDNQSH